MYSQQRHMHSQKRPMYSQKRPIHSQKRTTYEQKRNMYFQKRPMYSQKRPMYSVHGTEDRSILVFWCVLIHVFSTHGIPCVEDTCIRIHIFSKNTCIRTWEYICTCVLNKSILMFWYMCSQHNVFSCSDTCILNTNTWDRWSFRIQGNQNTRIDWSAYKRIRKVIRNWMKVCALSPFPLFQGVCHE